MNRSFVVAFKGLMWVLLFVSLSFLCISCEKKENPAQAKETESTENTDETKEEKKEEELPPPTPKEVGYAYGVILAKAARMNHLDVDANAVYNGFKDNAGKEEIDIAPQEVVLKRAFAEGKKKYGRENLAKEEAFLEKNKNVEGVITLESGLQYKVLKKGDESSAKPEVDSKVKIVYSGKVLDAENEFDSSQGEAVELSLENVIEGWKQVVPLMNIGDEVEVYIPSKLGYGESGISYSGQEIIPPSALLIFKMELKEILPKEAKESEDSPNDAK